MSGRATVHVKTHALGLPFYELTTIVIKHGKENYSMPVRDKKHYYYDRLLFWQENKDQLGLEWAGFLINNAETGPSEKQPGAI
jgi:hypothetical protein